MKGKLFNHRFKKKSTERTPGEPWDNSSYDRGDETEDNYKYVKSKDSFSKSEDGAMGRSKGNPSGYEGKEHVKYKDPGYSSHHIRFPQDEPHMKSNNDSNEAHEMEDNYHMDVPNQTKYALEAKLKRARMKMDAPDQEDPDVLRGNLVNNVGYKGEKDTSGEEEMGPNDMQKSESKERRKKMIVAVTRKKMKK